MKFVDDFWNRLRYVGTTNYLNAGQYPIELSHCATFAFAEHNPGDKVDIELRFSAPMFLTSSLMFVEAGIPEYMINMIGYVFVLHEHLILEDINDVALDPPSQASLKHFMQSAMKHVNQLPVCHILANADVPDPAISPEAFAFPFEAHIPIGRESYKKLMDLRVMEVKAAQMYYEIREGEQPEQEEQDSEHTAPIPHPPASLH